MIEKIKNSKGLLIFTVISFWICVLGLVGGINDAMTGGKRYSEEEMQLKVNTAVQEQKDKDEKTRKSLEDKIDELNALIKINEQKLKDKENEFKEQSQENKEQEQKKTSDSQKKEPAKKKTTPVKQEQVIEQEPVQQVERTQYHACQDGTPIYDANADLSVRGRANECYGHGGFAW